jgi:hypothetical protein
MDELKEILHDLITSHSNMLPIMELIDDNGVSYTEGREMLRRSIVSTDSTIERLKDYIVRTTEAQNRRTVSTPDQMS